MPTNWVVPTVQSLATILDQTLIDQCNQNVPTIPGPLDYTQPNQAGLLLALEIQTIQSYIISSGRFPLSLTPSAIPPESEIHCLVSVVFKLVVSTPSTLQQLLTQDESFPLARQFAAAQVFFKQLREAPSELSLVLPTDPTGVDYATAPTSTNNLIPTVTPAVNLQVHAVWWGDQYGTVEEYEAGVHTVIQSPNSGPNWTVPLAPLDLNTTM